VQRAAVPPVLLRALRWPEFALALPLQVPEPQTLLVRVLEQHPSQAPLLQAEPPLQQAPLA
jgi:hypothetical protein